MTVVLAQGESTTIEGGRIRMGLGWDPDGQAGVRTGLRGVSGVDLDASCLLFDADGHLVETVWSRQLTSKDGAVVHSGDNTTGHGEGDDEVITVDLDALPLRVSRLVFTVSSFSSDDFSKVAGAFSRVVDGGGRELVRYELSGTAGSNAQLTAKVARTAGGWSVRSLGAPAKGNTFNDLLPEIHKHL